MASRRTRSAVHHAVLVLARERRVGALTMEGIAARAGVSKQTLYRTWSSTGAILFDALLARSEDESGAVVVPESPDLAADLTLLATATVTELTDATLEPVLRAVTADLQADGDLADQFRERLLQPQLAAIAGRLRRAGVADPEDVAELFVGAIFHRWLLRTRPFDPAWVSGHVDRVLRSAGLT